MPSPPDDQERYVPIETRPPDAFVDYWSPDPGPDGYHADFSRPFGLPDEVGARLWVARVYVGGGRDVLFGPFNTRDEVVSWVLSLDLGDLWMIEPVKNPQDWPGTPLEPPPEPETPLLDRLESS